jgi:IclR family transcriptional regulator, pca regulon regulatory protein
MSTQDQEIETPGASGEFIQSLERGLTVIRVFDAHNAELTLSDAARLAGLTRATTRRILHTLETLGYVRMVGRLFMLTPKVLDLGYAYLSSVQVGDIALPYMEALSEKLHESVSAAVLDGTDIVYVARVPTRKIMRLSLGIGTRLPAVSTSMGRVLIADLAEDERMQLMSAVKFEKHTERTITDRDQFCNSLATIRNLGWALVDQELEEGLRSIAAPLRDRNGRAIAALNVGTQTGLVSLKELRNDLLPLLLECAQAISIQLAKR